MLLAHELLKKGVPRDRVAFALCRVGDSESEIDEAREYIQQAGYHVLAGELPERTAFRRAADTGRALTETPFESLNIRADQLAQSIVDLITRADKKGRSVVNG